nr:MAG TPA: hypothetical protein [Caudoviricetes sp.]DAP42221.1 MAG TPA: hypothetical protein [Bacteriophage sp.]DAU48884.1 MAG TPA: hypothetical protein [Caudoviricetes sp.]
MFIEMKIISHFFAKTICCLNNISYICTHKSV